MSQISDMTDQVREWTVRKGWRGPKAPRRTFGDDIALLHSELSEALEAFRDFKMQEVYRNKEGKFSEDFLNVDGVTLNKPEGVGSELADVLVRLLDTCAEYKIDLEAKFLEKMEYNETREHRHGGKNL